MISMLPTVEFLGLNPTRLIIGANPFGGFSHQGKERNQEMLAYLTPERIIETWRRAEAAGINTMITNNESPSYLDVDGDGQRELLYGTGETTIAIARPTDDRSIRLFLDTRLRINSKLLLKKIKMIIPQDEKDQL